MNTHEGKASFEDWCRETYAQHHEIVDLWRNSTDVLKKAKAILIMKYAGVEESEK